MTIAAAVRYCCLIAAPLTATSSRAPASHRLFLVASTQRQRRGHGLAFRSALAPSPSLSPGRPTRTRSPRDDGALCPRFVPSRAFHATTRVPWHPRSASAMSTRRSGRISSAAAAAKASGEANDANDNDAADVSKNGSSRDTGAVLKGSEPSEGDGAAKRTTKKKKSPAKEKKASPKKKAAKTKAKGRTEAEAATSDGESAPKAKAKAKAAPKKRKSVGGASSDDDATSKGEKKAPKKKKAAAADHQRWTERTPVPRLWDPKEATSESGGYPFTVISWNVAGLRAFVKKRPDALADLAARYDADVICLQETKLQEMHLDDPKLKLKEHFEEKLGGYDAHWSCSVEKKGYAGTAVFVRRRGGGKKAEGGDGAKGKKKQATLGAFFAPAEGNVANEADAAAAEDGGGGGSTGDVPPADLTPLDVSTELGLPAHDGEGRAITVEYPLFYLTNVYVPNSGAKLDRLGYRTENWDADFLAKMRRLEAEGNKPIVWLGDLNVAHNEKDTWNEGAKHLPKSAGTTPQERASFERQQGAGYVDAFRRLHPEARGHYSYWSQRAGNREPNKGLRLDYFVCSEELMEDGDGRRVVVRDSFMVPDELGSDHCPIVLEMEIKK
ncbi:hypothetical protein ACHAWF_013493 [Thalassiosira exigua]